MAIELGDGLRTQHEKLDLLPLGLAQADELEGCVGARVGAMDLDASTQHLGRAADELAIQFKLDFDPLSDGRAALADDKRAAR